jgi:arylsulfatase A-like enzyme
MSPPRVVAGTWLRWIWLSLLAAILDPARSADTTNTRSDRPNILWIVVEDMSPHFGCYGERTIQTPNVDQLAAAGTRFTRAFVTAPICSISRSALITGMYQTSIGAHHHRSGRGPHKIHLPSGATPVPALFQAAGYLTANLTFEEFIRPASALATNAAVGIAKTEYNFEWNDTLYQRLHWTARPAGQPFFAQVQLHGGKLRGDGNRTNWPNTVTRTLGTRTPPEAVRLPPDLPDDPVIREDWAQYLDTVRYTDWQIGRILTALREAGELDRTILCFLTDHGISHVRHKQFLYDGGTHVPLIIAGPGIDSGRVRTDLIEHIDLAATSLALAGIPIPASMQGRDVLARDYVPRRHVFAARDRADETEDRMRSVRTERFKFIRNHRPERPYLQPNAYKDGKSVVQAIRRLHAAGQLSPAQALILADRRPPEELYDLAADPFELHNLATDPAHATTLTELRAVLAQWEAHTGDRGRTPETPEVYDAEMHAEPKESGRLSDNPRFLENVTLMKRWAREGR